MVVFMSVPLLKMKRKTMGNMAEISRQDSEEWRFGMMDGWIGRGAVRSLAALGEDRIHRRYEVQITRFGKFLVALRALDLHDTRSFHLPGWRNR